MKTQLITSLFVLFVSFSVYAQEDKPAQKDKKIAEKEVKSQDPVCHMKVAKNTKITFKHKDNTYGFCGESCKESFVKNPDKYIKN
ncbi:hypothetical protein EMA8858_01954 [Emticicia aquatica]|jgi:YHS domain-containing protein|uniref:TRASH domain-containing protein n=1 Tax=Emticicia aquatica TaxID=1681835 RepID=A0ABM9APK2_9BACT|nr:YHS domain-containing protein [Emticicia aquatica]CAH0995826.1 hypothetical protein EMA8858_01954 [Emticicia aquatica]